jgi:hypothetical protein
LIATLDLVLSVVFRKIRSLEGALMELRKGVRRKEEERIKDKQVVKEEN